VDRPIIRVALAAAIALLGGSNARSESISISYWYSMARPAEVPPHTTVDFNVWSGGGYGVGTIELGTTPLPLAPISIVTSGPPPLTPVSIPDGWRYIDFLLEFKDEASGDQGYFFLGGELIGEVGYDTSTMVLKTTHSSNRTEARVGGYLYQLWFPDEIAVPSWLARSVTVSPQITVRKLTSAEHAPEPSTLALGAVAALGLAARRWLRRRGGSA
jgi:hypothetical protein